MYTIVYYESATHAQLAAIYPEGDYPSAALAVEHERLAKEAGMVVTESTEATLAEVLDVLRPNAPEDTIALSWHIDDVKSRNSDLTDEQARDVLQRLKNDHDATIGVNWEVIDIVIDIYLGE